MDLYIIGSKDLRLTSQTLFDRTNQHSLTNIEQLVEGPTYKPESFLGQWEGGAPCSRLGFSP